MLLSDLRRADISGDALRLHNTRQQTDMAAFVDQDVGQSTNKLDMSLYGLDSIIHQETNQNPKNALKRPYSPPIKHL